MLIPDTTLTEALARWISRQHDDGQPGLVATQTGRAILVARADGSECSESEQVHVLAVLAANAAEPFTK